MTSFVSLARAGALAVVLAAGALTASGAQAQQGNPDFILVNNSRMTIMIMQASPVTDQNWGNDRLGNDVVQPGGRYTVNLNSPGVCQWDVRVIYENRQAEERRNINLCTITELAFEGARTAPVQ
jgi:hypothetical protein